MNQDILIQYEKWLNSAYISEEEKKELLAIKNDEKEVENRFYTDLSFGTAGMRGIRGIGRNRMNRYNIRKATQGLANYIIKTCGDEGKKKGVVIAYDCRLDSEENAMNTALVLAANGIKAYLFESIRTTPELSFAVRELGTQAGVMITASHNPKEYNGYKVYFDDGAQIVDPHAKGIVDSVKAVDVFDDVKIISKEDALAQNLIIFPQKSLDDRYIEEVKKNSINPDLADKEKLTVVYSPLHGTAGRPVNRVFDEMGYKYVNVEEQIKPDGNFPTCDYANPEDTKVFKLLTDLADKVGAQICMANDPDGDRVGIAIRDDKNEWFIPNGNQIGILIAEYILSNLKEIPKNAKMISTIVSTPMLDTVAESYGIEALRTLTGFKYIGEKIRLFEEKKLDGTFLFGFEEAIGYLIGTHVRDKDAVVTSMLLAEMAVFYNNKNSSLYKELIKIYEKYGWRLEKTIAITKQGKSGLEEITNTMIKMRNKEHSEIAGLKVAKFTDFNQDGTGLPKSDVLQFVLEDKTYVTLRPSGTEPKIKYYISVVDSTKDKAEEKLEKIAKDFETYVDNI